MFLYSRLVKLHELYNRHELSKMRLLKVIKAILVNGIQPLNGAVIVLENQRKDNLQYRNQHHLLQVLRIEEVLQLHRFTMNTKCNIGAKTVLASQLRILNHVFHSIHSLLFSASFTMTTMIVNEDVISPFKNKFAYFTEFILFTVTPWQKP